MQSKLDLINTGSLTGCDLIVFISEYLHECEILGTVPVAQQGGFCL